MLVMRPREAKTGEKSQREARSGRIDCFCHLGGRERGDTGEKQGKGPAESAESLSVRSSSINSLSQQKILDCGLSHNTAQSVSRQDTTRICMSAAFMCSATKPHPTLKKGKKEWNKMATAFISLTQTPQASLPQRRLFPHSTDHSSMWRGRRLYALACCSAAFESKLWKWIHDYLCKTPQSRADGHKFLFFSWH